MSYYVSVVTIAADEGGGGGGGGDDGDAGLVYNILNHFCGSFQFCRCVKCKRFDGVVQKPGKWTFTTRRIQYAWKECKVNI